MTQRVVDIAIYVPIVTSERLQAQVEIGSHNLRVHALPEKAQLGAC
jgi:hypothetical protein